MIEKVAFIGAGKVAWHLAQALQKHCEITEIYSRNLDTAQELAERVSANATNSLDFSKSEAQLLIISIPDDAIEGVSKELKITNNVLVVHTSGAKPREIFDPFFEKNGVFYPLQTFSKEKEVDFLNIPFCLDAKQTQDLENLKNLADLLSKKVYKMTSEQRGNLHVAAVFANNFVNHFLTIAENQLAKANLPLEILENLVRETIDKAFDIGPSNAQTGPAIRGDKQTIQQHLKRIEEESRKELYQKLSKDIQDFYSTDRS
ncbi:Rossmann-like and DUF2520 domain-containing protein [Sediminitomix flava]|uniref:Putative short-subunit dehydrogenase-like oxidoreductase (DUF2520 family) n=1 Tax=Sediminitomix flava TaxID=379075 RepID=A0A316A2J8_SEDFL|nr:Rossmann-like and DUF2520 domain-containing protein [Sediminitomix flava]PWJ43927.1 putative short-subunit dehydrogenase-like oxidoreductase (DUF2520 family) [Sediminitomix flava]